MGIQKIHVIESAHSFCEAHPLFIYLKLKKLLLAHGEFELGFSRKFSYKKLKLVDDGPMKIF